MACKVAVKTKYDREDHKKTLKVRQKGPYICEFFKGKKDWTQIMTYYWKRNPDIITWKNTGIINAVTIFSISVEQENASIL